MMDYFEQSFFALLEARAFDRFWLLPLLLVLASALILLLPFSLNIFTRLILLLEIVLNLSGRISMWKMLNIAVESNVVVVIVKCRSIYGQHIESTNSYLAHRSSPKTWCFNLFFFLPYASLDPLSKRHFIVLVSNNRFPFHLILFCSFWSLRKSA